MSFQGEVAVRGADRLGECPLWDEREGALWWVDSRWPAVKRFDPSGGAVTMLVLPEIVKIAKEEKPDPDPAWQQYLGTYTNDWGVVEIVIRDKQLQMINVDFIDMPPVILEPTDEAHVFTLKVPGESNETARFEFDDAGKIARLWERNEYYLPKT